MLSSVVDVTFELVNWMIMLGNMLINGTFAF